MIVDFAPLKEKGNLSRCIGGTIMVRMLMTKKKKMIRNMIKAFACKIACPIQSESWIALSSLEQWQSSMSGDAMMRMMRVVLMRLMVMMRMLMIP